MSLGHHQENLARVGLIFELRGLRDADDECGTAGIAGIEDAADFVVALEEGIVFIGEERWAQFLDDTEEGSSA